MGVVVSLLSLTGLTALPPAVWAGLFIIFLLGLLKVYTKHYYKVDLDGGELIRCRKRFNKVSELQRSPLEDSQAVVLLARRRHDETGEGFQYSPAVWTNGPKLTKPLYWTHSYQEALTACRQIATAAKTPVYAGPPERETQVTFNRRGELLLTTRPAQQRSPLFYIAIGAWVFTLICAGTV